VSGALRSAARAYAAAGWKVFPVEPGGKMPVIPKNEGGNGYHDATTDPAQIATWWTRWPHANIGVSCRPSGIVVIDVDRRHDGHRTITDLQQRHGSLDARLVAATPNGWHAYYLDPGGDLAGKLGEGIDIKANGYVVAPPSQRPDGAYRWLRPGTPTPLPDWAITLLRPKPVVPRRPVDWTRPGRDVERNVRAIIDAAANAAAGNRNNALWWAARTLAADHIAARTLSIDDVTTLLLAAAQASGGLSDDGERGTRATILSGIRRGLNDRVAVTA
jgi:hypothetical protein